MNVLRGYNYAGIIYLVNRTLLSSVHRIDKYASVVVSKVLSMLWQLRGLAAAYRVTNAKKGNKRARSGNNNWRYH